MNQIRVFDSTIFSWSWAGLGRSWGGLALVRDRLGLLLGPPGALLGGLVVGLDDFC